MSDALQTLPIPVELLGLTDVKVIKVALTPENEFIICVESTVKEINCHQCGKLTRPYGKGRPVHLRHLPILGKKTYIEITPPRGRCLDCDNQPTTTQQASWSKIPHHYNFKNAYKKHIKPVVRPIRIKCYRVVL